MAITLAKRIGRHLSRVRLAQGLSQQQVADAAGLRGKATISEVENGLYAGLALDTLEQICKVLNLTVKEFFESMPGF